MSCCFGKNTDGKDPKKTICRFRKNDYFIFISLFSADHSNPSSNRPIIPVTVPINPSRVP